MENKNRHISETGRHILETHPYVVENIDDSDCFVDIIYWTRAVFGGKEERVITCWNNYYFRHEVDCFNFKMRWL